MSLRTVLTAVLLAAALPAAANAQSRPAEWRAPQDEARAAVRAGRHVPLERVIAAIRGRTPGRLLDSALERGPDGRSVYRVRWAADNGRRVDYMADAETGAILSGEGR